MALRFRISIFLLLVAAVLPGQAMKAFLVTKKATPENDVVAPSLPMRIIRAAVSYLGVPYVHAGDSRSGMDCSGFIARVFLDIVGTNLPRGVEGLYRATMPARAPLHIGDLLFFDTTERQPPSQPTHVGIYIGGGRLVHAASEGSKTGVIASSVDDPYYRDRFIGARRVLPWRDPVLDIRVTDETERLTEAEPFASSEDVTIRVFNEMSGGGPVSFSLMKDGREVLSRWLAVGAKKPAEVSFETGVGSWTVRITRIFKGRILSDVSFLVVE